MFSMSSERKKDLHKIKNLLEIVEDSSRRCPLETLLKCEQVLEKMEFKFLRSDSSALTTQTQPTTGISKIQDHNIGQPLIDAVVNNIKKPFFNHTLHRTFGPAISALCTFNFKIPSPPVKRAKVESYCDVPDVLQGEIARLEQRFKVQMDPLQHPGSKAINLICRLDDKDLPCVPPISIYVPHGYPSKPPQCITDDDEEYQASPFLRQIQKTFSESINKLCANYSITVILHRWEMSVRQTCSQQEALKLSY
ncbi:hypothetical protein B4U79_13884 [Dinothrombium tinctorium]|uniref:Uncharacterized protein n=1 Tax=Dinothrombium tinctorium TaxID=1965070 RepID=A0A443QIF7_9ACAR|nr:hypothetical protein B4U79_13884 [Dinothrombium tinctorium]